MQTILLFRSTHQFSLDWLCYSSAWLTPTAVNGKHFLRCKALHRFQQNLYSTPKQWYWNVRNPRLPQVTHETEEKWGEVQVEEYYSEPESCRRHSMSKPHSFVGLEVISPPQAHQNAEATWLLSWGKDGMPVPGGAAGSHPQSQWVKHAMLPARGRGASPNTEGGAFPVPKKPRGRSRQQEQQPATKALWNMKGRNK